MVKQLGKTEKGDWANPVLHPTPTIKSSSALIDTISSIFKGLFGCFFCMSNETETEFKHPASSSFKCPSSPKARTTFSQHFPHKPILTPRPNPYQPQPLQVSQKKPTSTTPLLQPPQPQTHTPSPQQIPSKPTPKKSTTTQSTTNPQTTSRPKTDPLKSIDAKTLRQGMALGDLLDQLKAKQK